MNIANFALAKNDRVPRELRPFPAAIPIHRVIASHHGGDTRAALVEFAVQVVRKSAPPVGEVSRPSVKACSMMSETPAALAAFASAIRCA